MSKTFKTQFYRHYKNKPYVFHNIVKHSETLEDLAYYECRYENKLGVHWVRPKEMFFEKVVIDGLSRPRFEHIGFIINKLSSLNDSENEKFKKLFFDIFHENLSQEKIDKHLERGSKKFNFYVVSEELNPSEWIGFKIIYEKTQDEWYSWLGGVKAEYQRLGLAQYMLDEAVQDLKTMNVKKISSQVLQKNFRMMLFNSKNSFYVNNVISSARGLKVLMTKDLV